MTINATHGEVVLGYRQCAYFETESVYGQSVPPGGQSGCRVSAAG